MGVLGNINLLNLFWIEIFQHVIVDPELSWCKSEKIYEEDNDHDLVRYYPVNDGQDQLVLYNF